MATAKKDEFLSMLAAPAKRALENKGITTLEQLSRHIKTDIATWHGIGPNALTKLHSILKTNNLSFKK